MFPTVARAPFRRALHALALLAATLPLRAAGAARGRACDPSACALARPTQVELRAILDDAERMLARYAGDATPLGRQCFALGATMKARAADVRMIPFMWRVPDPDGYLAPVTGDAHTEETVAGTGRVHIARGYDPLNPDRGLAAILQTARHEFAHLNGSRQREGWGVDVAAHLATACGPERAP